MGNRGVAGMTATPISHEFPMNGKSGVAGMTDWEIGFPMNGKSGVAGMTDWEIGRSRDDSLT